MRLSNRVNKSTRLQTLPVLHGDVDEVERRDVNRDLQDFLDRRKVEMLLVL